MGETKDISFFTPEEQVRLVELKSKLQELAGDCLRPEVWVGLHTLLATAIEEGRLGRDNFGLNPIVNNLQTAIIVVDEMGMRRAAIISILLHDIVKV